jgi:hypothetical protein
MYVRYSAILPHTPYSVILFIYVCTVISILLFSVLPYFADTCTYSILPSSHLLFYNTFYMCMYNILPSSRFVFWHTLHIRGVCSPPA